MNRARFLRWIRNTVLVVLAVFAIGTIWYITEVRINDPLTEGEACIVPERSTDTTGRWHVGNNWLVRDSSGLYEAYIEGSDLERGLALGSLARGPIERQEGIFTERLRAMVPGEGKLGFLKYFVAWFNRDLDEHVLLEYQREIFGVSRSFSDAFDEVGPKYMRALNYHAAHDIGHALQDLALVGCTSFAARGDRTTDSSLLIGRNFDFWMGDAFSREKLVLFIRPEHGIPHALITWGGFMGAVSAMNTEGLTVTINAARSATPYSARTPISLLAREIVQYAPTIDSAIVIARRREVFVSESILIGSARDGRAVIIEKTPDGMDVFTPEGDLLVCANHFQSPRFANAPVNLANIRESDSRTRFDRMRALTDTARSLDPTSAVRILRDRDTGAGREIGFANPLSINQFIAHHGVVFQPVQRRMWVSAWPYQCGTFVCYDLQEVFSRCASGGITGRINDNRRTIAEDPIVRTVEFARYQQWSDLRVRIAGDVLRGDAFAVTPAEEDSFALFNPACYITWMSLGDLHRAKGDHRTAAAHYATALHKPVASLEERARIEQRLAECTAKQKP